MKTAGKWMAFLAILGLGLGGCATITNTPKQQVSLVASNGKKVVVTINGEKVTLPTTMKIPRKPTDIYVYAKDNPGYQYSHTNTSVIGGITSSPVAFLNVLGVLVSILPGVISIAVDETTGSAYTYSNQELVVPVYKAAK